MSAEKHKKSNANTVDAVNDLRHQLRLREAEISLLKEVTDAVSSQLNLDTVLQLIAERTRTLINAELVLIPVLSRDCTEYTYQAGSGQFADEIVGETLPRNFGVCGWVWEHKRAWWRGVLDELQEAERSKWEKEAGSVILVPLIGKKHFLGGIAGHNKIGKPEFDERDLELLTMFASQVSIAIENAMVFEELSAAKLRSDTLQKELRQLNDKLTQANKELEQLALYDSLTDLPNRNLLYKYIQQTINHCNLENICGAVMIIDLDRFKEVNDTLGHNVGDKLLYKVGQRFKSTLLENGYVGRLGGDEFAVIVSNTSAAEAIQVAQSLLHALEAPFELQNNHYYMDASIGISLSPQHGSDITSLLKRADVAMYAAKHGDADYYVYEQNLDLDSHNRLNLAADLREACNKQSLQFYYQPKMDILTNRIIGAETLARWHHPQHGMVSPDVFIPILEQTGLIKSFTRFALESALQQHNEWRQMGYEITVAVNISMHNLRDPNFPGMIADLLRQWDVQPHCLIMELTESVVMEDPQRTPAVLRKLVKLGIDFSIDDYGTGYSSLSYLKKLPVTELKIDRSFVAGISTNKDDAIIVRSTIEMAHHLGLRVVAEGAEDQETLQKLRAMHCEQVQGYYISRPVPASDFLEFIRRFEHKQRLA